jgi:hypothetical protein
LKADGDIMKVNITAGECLNKLLKNKFPAEEFIPFNEAMIQGWYSALLFSDEFVRERSAIHRVSEEEYRDRLSGFMQVLENVNEYDKIVLWFGCEPFCSANRQTVLDALRQYGYSRNILLNTVDETTGDILRQEHIKI